MLRRGLLLATCLLSLLSGCGDDGAPRDAGPSVEAALPPPDLRLLVITDLKGYLGPCGCTTRPLGGIDRMAARVAERRADAPTVLVVSGDTLFGGDAHGAEGAETQERWQAETLVGVLGSLGAAAVTPGEKDLSQGLGPFRELAAAAPFPWLAAGIESAPPPEGEAAPPSPFRDRVVVEAGGRKVGLLGVTDLSSADGALPEGLRASMPPAEAARAAATALREEGATVVVALVRGDRRLSRAVAGVPGVDFVIQGGLDRDEATPPSESGSAWLVQAGRQGQGLVVVDLYVRGQGPWVNVSGWNREVDAARLRGEVEDLRGRIAEWERGSADPADLATQRERLARMETELAAATRPLPLPADGNAFSARFEELPPEAPKDAAVTAAVDALDRRVNEHNRTALAHLVPPAVPEGQAGYVGAARCAGCHEAAFAWWTGHPHGRAYQTLVDRHKEFNLSCVGCHVTGYGRPGGSTVTHNEGLVNVGCEVCHGPGSLHVEAQDGGHIERAVPERVCVHCHNEEHSDRFVYEAYRTALLVPGHGRPLPSRSP